MAFLYDFRGPGLPEGRRERQKRLLENSVFVWCEKVGVQNEFFEIFVEFWVSFWSPGAPQKGRISFQVFCLCLEGPRGPFGGHFGVILGSFWGSFLMFFGSVSGLLSGCPGLLGFCFLGAWWGAFRCVFSVSSLCFLSVCVLSVCVLSVCSPCVFSLCRSVLFFLWFFALLAGFSSPCSLCEFCVFSVCVLCVCVCVCVCVCSRCVLSVCAHCSLGVFSRCVLSVFFLCVLSSFFFSVCVCSLRVLSCSLCVLRPCF